MKMDPKQQTERDFRDLVDDVISSKNTNSLYQLKSQIERNLKDKSIHNRSLILESVKKLRNLVTSKLLENVLKKAIEIDDYELCAEIVRSVQILEEKHVVDCLKYFLKDIKSDYEVDNVVESKLDLVFHKTYDYRLLTMELKNLSSNEFIICLQYLRKYLKKSFQGNEDGSENQQDISDDQSDSKPTILQIVDLFACFIDAHFTHITLLPVAQEIVLDSLQLIETQLDLFTDMTAIEALVKEMKRNKQFRVKDNNDINYYFVEVLKL